MKLLDIKSLPASADWDIRNFWTDEEKIKLGFKKADNVMNLDEFKSFIDSLVNDMQKFKEEVECLKM